ncbi:hypothetical protein LWI29_017947 [Acer saccharum]|uniref:Thaumatin-like protein n=1 Tax=Acer saccharum TaxID=4024 RepID=A0AA39SR13_ACESA|nr:hypothetical protein LWI29_017947 [Acer saccharum]
MYKQLQLPEAVPGGGRELKHDQEWVFDTDRNFRDIGRIWARTNCKLDRSENHEGDLIAGIPSWRSIYGEDGVGEGGGEHGIQCEAREVRRSCENQDNTGSPTFTDLGLNEAKHMVEKEPVVVKKGPTNEEAIPMFKTQEFGTTSVFYWFRLEIEDEGLRDAEGKAALPGGGRELKHGQDWVVNTDPNFEDRGRIWARTNCKFDANGIGKCETGDCNGDLYCLGGGEPPCTVAEYGFRRGNNDTDFFDISLVDGFNVPMEIRGTSSKCSKGIKCVGDINGLCPTELRHSGTGCNHPCTVFNNKQFCCDGGPESCNPTEAYFKFFKDLCPNAYSYSYDDDTTAMFTCPTGSDYKVVFCPSSLQALNLIGFADLLLCSGDIHARVLDEDFICQG